MNIKQNQQLRREAETKANEWEREYKNSPNGKWNKLTKDRQKNLLNKKSKSESYFKQLLVDSNIFFERELITSSEGQFFYTDFYIPRFNLCIELDGREHLSTKVKDQYKERFIIDVRKAMTIRFTNEEVLAMNSISWTVITKKMRDKLPNLNIKRHLEKVDALDHENNRRFVSMARNLTKKEKDTPITLTYKGSTFNFANIHHVRSTRLPYKDVFNSLLGFKKSNGLSVKFNNPIFEEQHVERRNEEYGDIVTIAHASSDIVIYLHSVSTNQKNTAMVIGYHVYEGDQLLGEFKANTDVYEFASGHTSEILSAIEALKCLVSNDENPKSKITVFSSNKFFTSFVVSETFKHKPHSRYTDVLPDLQNIMSYFKNIDFVWIPKQFNKAKLNK